MRRLPVDNAWEPPRTVQQRVVQMLRTRILNGELAAGTRLIQNDIAAMMKVSTTPVREALRQLQTEGLVHIDEHRGGVVRGLNEEELEDLLRWRRYMEPEAIRQAVPLSEEAHSRALKLHEQMADPEITETEFALLNREFHLTIYGSGGSKALIAIMQILIDPVVAYVNASLDRLPTLRIRSLSEHQRLIEALEREDVEEAIRLQLAHIERPRLEWLASDGSSFSNPDESVDLDSSSGRVQPQD
jgi:DNA-binding GntR family transcriptional regulator